jgi:hypothetical protein
MPRPFLYLWDRPDNVSWAVQTLTLLVMQFSQIPFRLVSLRCKYYSQHHSSVPRNFFRWGGGVQQIQLRTEGRENGDLGAVAPSKGFHSICKWAKPVFWLGCYRCIFHRTGNLAQLFQNFGISGGGGVWTPPNHPPGYASDCWCSLIILIFTFQLLNFASGETIS